MKLRDLLNDDQIEPAEAALAQAHPEAMEVKDPVILKVLTAVSAWVASLFLLGFIVLAGQPDESSTFAIGALLAGLAIMVHYSQKNAGTFVAQSTLSCMMCGHLMMLVGVVLIMDYQSDEMLTLAITQTLLCALPVWIFRRAAYQLIALLLAAFFWTYYAVEMDAPWLFRLVLAVQVSALAALTLWRGRRSSFGYALALSVGATLFFLDWIQSMPRNARFDEALWPTNLIIAVFLAAIGGHLLPVANRWQPKVLVLFVMLVALAFLSSPGLLFAIALLTLGYGLRDPIYTGLGLIGLPTFIIFFYYSLQVSLLEKSGILLASGIVCLLVAYLAHSSLEKGASVEAANL